MICRNHPDAAEGVRRCANCSVPFCPDCLVEIDGRPYCANCKTERLLDVRSGVDRTTLTLASNWKRFGALIVDNLITQIPVQIISMGITLGIGSVTEGGDASLIGSLFTIPLIFVHVIYEALMMQHKNGQTLGKMAVGIRVVNPDGSSISAGQAWGRSGLRLVLGCCIIVDYIPALFTEEKTTLHDMAAGTRVVEA